MMQIGNTSGQPLLILGASTRAAAASARAAGFVCHCADQFADADLAGMATAVEVTDYPTGLECAARAAPAGPWLYTGALENRPALVARLAAQRPLLGNTADVLRRVRDPFAVLGALRAAGLPSPPLAAATSDASPNVRWLHKSRASSGGQFVRRWQGASLRAGEYLQEFIRGVPCAAIYLAAAGQARFLGATEQLLVDTDDYDEKHGRLFRYAGSVGPLRLPAARRLQLIAIGRLLAEEFQLVGLFGVDYIDDGQAAWPVEINPRYTASVEIIERGMCVTTIDQHVAACESCALPAQAAVAVPPAANRWHAKRIVYATRPAEVSAEFTTAALAAANSERNPAVADIPRAGTRLAPGQPVMTVFAEGESRAAVLASLARHADFWKSRLEASAV